MYHQINVLLELLSSAQSDIIADEYNHALTVLREASGILEFLRDAR